MVSQVPGHPSCAFAAFSDPGRALAPSLRGRSVAGSCCLPAAFASCRCLIPPQCAVSPPRGASVPSPLLPNRGPQHLVTFEALSRGLHARCLRFAAFLFPQELYGHARLASGWWPACAGRDWLPAGVLREVSV